MRAVLYARLSYDPDGLSTAPDRQLADCRSMVAARGWEVGEYVERDVSAFRHQTRRPAYEAMITDLETGLSIHYCALIRRGERIPHAMWWHRLALPGRDESEEA